MTIRRGIWTLNMGFIVAALMLGAPSQSAAQEAPSISIYDMDCAALQAYGIDRQANIRAAILRSKCGGSTSGDALAGASAPVVGGIVRGKSLASPMLGGTDANASPGADPYPSVTQSESFVWGNGNTVVVTMNTSPGALGAGGSYGIGSTSTDGGATFTRYNPNPFASGHGQNYGDPNVVFNANLNTWYAGFLATGCGGQGIGGWTSADGVSWSAGACMHNGGFDDRQSMWVDNNSSSPYYGRMYVSWNDFNAGQGIYCVRSDNGTSWTNSTVVSTFIRNVQVTGGPDGTVFIAGMDEQGGSGAPSSNIMYRSTDGGVSWSSVSMGASFPKPGSNICGFFNAVTPIWRHQGWGQPGVGPGGVVHYDYCQHGAGGDLGDIMYQRSTDNGATWSSPVKLNTDTGTQAQWMPSLSVTASGAVLAAWYDRRNTTNGTNYEYWGRVSTDNGATWQPDEAISDLLSAQPSQPDGSIQSCYAGDYNYHSVLGNDALVTWVDGRNVITVNQQDVYFDRVPLLVCGAITITPSTLPAGTVGTPYSQTLTASGGTGTYTYALTSGSLPAGLSLGSGGVISGTPTTAGSSSFTVTATDSNSCTGSQPYTIDVSCPTITLSPASLAAGSVGAAYSQTFTASGGTAPYTYAVTAGSLPPGLSLSSAGVLSGTPTAKGTYLFAVRATDSYGCYGGRGYTLTIRRLVDFILGKGLGQPNINEVKVYRGAGTATTVDFSAYAAGQWGVNVAGGDIEQAQYEDMLTGPGPGAVFGPQVRGFRRDGIAIGKVNFYAYGTLSYGVNVSSGDLDGDGYDEIITGPGPGTVFGPHVRGFNYDNSAITAMGKVSFYAYSTLRYGVNVAGGNVDGDAFDEIITGAGPSPAFGPTVRGFNCDGGPCTSISKINFGAYTLTGYGVNVACGDFDADGYDEIVTAPGPGPTHPAQVKGWNYDASTITLVFTSTTFSTVYGGRAGVGDVSNDGKEDLLAGAGRDPAANATVKAYDVSGATLTQLVSFNPFSGSFYGVNVAAGELGY